MDVKTENKITPILEEMGKQWYCPHYFSISGLQVGCRKGIWPMICHEGCPYGQWVEYTMTSASVGCEIDTEKVVENLLQEMEENKTKLVEVYDIDGHLTVGNDIEEAIKAYRTFFPTSMIKKITKIFAENDILGNAIILKK